MEHRADSKFTAPMNQLPPPKLSRSNTTYSTAPRPSLPQCVATQRTHVVADDTLHGIMNHIPSSTCTAAAIATPREARGKPHTTTHHGPHRNPHHHPQCASHSAEQHTCVRTHQRADAYGDSSLPLPQGQGTRNSQLERSRAMLTHQGRDRVGEAYARFGSGSWKKWATTPSQRRRALWSCRR